MGQYTCTYILVLELCGFCIPESEGSVQPFATEKIMISEEMFTMIRNG